MLTSILDDSQPSDSKKFKDKNYKRNKVSYNYNKNQQNLYQNENIYNDINEKNLSNNKNKKHRKKNTQKEKYLNTDDNENLYREYSNNDNYLNNNNYSSEKNSKSPHSNYSKYQNSISNNINSPYESNTIDNYKIPQTSNRQKKSFLSNNNINMNFENNINYNINDNYNKYENLSGAQKSISSIQKEKDYSNRNSIITNNNLSPRLSYEVKDYKNDNISNNEYYIKYVTLNRKGFEHIHERNYLSGLLVFQNCYELSKNFLKDEIKEINSLINISICEYYNGNFSESYTVINKAKIIYDSISLREYNISPKQKLQLTLKLFINSSLANLSINNYKESKNDILFLISTIRKESNINKQFLYFRTILFTLFKVESLINYDIDENNSLNNIMNSNNDIEISEPIKIINHLMKGFLDFLKEKNFAILLNTFKESAQKYKRLNDFNGYYFSLFYQYLVLYNQKKNNFDENELEEIKKKISICNNNLIGNELIKQVKEKDVNKLLTEFVEKINCACEIFQLLENFENELNNKLSEYNREKNNINLSEDESDLSYSHLLDKSHLFTNEKINSPIFVKLLLRYSLNFLENQKKNSNINSDNNNQNAENDNYELLINEIKFMMKKISSNEINIENIKLHQLDKEMINSLKQLFDNLVYIYYKSKLYKNFEIFRKKIHKIKNSEYINAILDFLSYNKEELVNGLNLIKINYKSKGYKTHFYDINENNLTFNVRKSENNNFPNKSYNLRNDIIKIVYGIKSRNLRKKLLSKDKDNESIKLLRMPWRFLSIITRARSIDLYCDDDQLDNVFYGFKYLFVDKKMPYKINSSNYFFLNKIKLKLSIKLKRKYEEEGEENYPNIVKQLSKEKAIQNISFTKLFLLYNKYK